MAVRYVEIILAQIKTSVNQRPLLGHFSFSRDKFAHIVGSGGFPRKIRQAEQFRHEPQRAFVLIAHGRSMALFDIRTHDHPGDVSAAAHFVRAVAFIEGDNQNSSSRSIEIRTGQQWINIRFQPGIRIGQTAVLVRTIMRIILVARHDESVIRQAVAVYVAFQLGDGHKIGCLPLVVADVGKKDSGLWRSA